MIPQILTAATYIHTAEMISLFKDLTWREGHSEKCQQFQDYQEISGSENETGGEGKENVQQLSYL